MSFPVGGKFSFRQLQERLPMVFVSKVPLYFLENSHSLIDDRYLYIAVRLLKRKNGIFACGVINRIVENLGEAVLAYINNILRQIFDLWQYPEPKYIIFRKPQRKFYIVDDINYGSESIPPG